MINIESFTFNPFQENTYIAYDESLECVIVDPGCYDDHEKDILESFITSKNLKPVALINTHCHLDHIFGNHFIAEKYKLTPIMHKLDLPMLNYAPEAARHYGVQLEKGSYELQFIEEGEQIHFGNSVFDVLFTPGHSPGHICLLNENEKILLSADVLFHLSIGRTDLPMGDHETLINSIKTKLLCLDKEVKVFPGHGPITYVGFEKTNNPFLK